MNTSSKEFKLLGNVQSNANTTQGQTTLKKVK